MSAPAINTNPLSAISQSASAEFDVIIVGGGLAGLTASIVLAQSHKRVLLIEKKSYPYNKVCGEYISNEVLGYLQSLGFDPFKFGATSINRLRVSTPKGKNIYTGLDLGGFGISRYTLDHALFLLAQKKGADTLTQTKVTDIKFDGKNFSVKTNTGQTFSSKLVIGSYGKRDMLDKTLKRDFLNKHTNYLGVKYHIKTDYPADEIGLDNFEGGYCGISKVENETWNLCYLYRRPEKRNYKTIPELQENVLYKNPVLKNIFTSSYFLDEQPEVINEIYFGPKKLVEDHVLMCGDTAGLITPLCGNGMSMAITTAKILCELILNSGFLDKKELAITDREALEVAYKKLWDKKFSSRLFWGRKIQGFFGNPLITSACIRSLHAIPPLERMLVKRTHGKPLV